MIIYNDIIQHNSLPSQGKLIALDLGTKRIGIASCDETRTICSPLAIINRKNNQADFEKISEFIKNNKIKAIIIGFPTHMDGTEIEMSDFVKKFANNFNQFLIETNQNLPIVFHDERLSSFEAEEIAKSIKSRKNQKHHDDIAACMILESFLLNLK